MIVRYIFNSFYGKIAQCLFTMKKFYNVLSY